ncbi:helix-hairpin-helix domain-containing protein [Anaerotignum sp.]|uniref:ComEA family DNA-binding protein n=1 Tax=Anaerotignum sp. TaxID=2039241 RepID=UPI00332F50B2
MGAAIGTEGLELKWSGDYRLFLPGTIDKININTADQEALQALPGVGEKLAKAIVQYRKEKGLYHTVDEIVNVPGIGLKKLNQIKEFTIAE